MLALFPGLPRFYLPFAFTINTQEWKTDKRQGEELIFKYVCTKLESKFLTSQDE